MKDLTKSLVLKRDNYTCIIDNGCKGAVGVHHEQGYYGNLQAGIPLQNLPWRNFKEQMFTLCKRHHAYRTQDEGSVAPSRGWLIRDIRKKGLELYPDYYSQFDVLGGI